MDKQTAELAIRFLQRAQLTGGEVGAFMQVIAALNEIVNPPSAPAQPQQ